MLPLNYLNPKNGLPDLNGPLSLRLSSQAIVLANSKVEATRDSNKKNVANTRSKYHSDHSLDSFLGRELSLFSQLLRNNRGILSHTTSYSPTAGALSPPHCTVE